MRDSRYLDRLGLVSVAVAAALVATLTGVVAVGGWIFYNTNVLNDYRTPKEENRRAALSLTTTTAGAPSRSSAGSASQRCSPCS